MAKAFVIGGDATKRVEVLNYVAMKGGASKREILKAIWGLDSAYFTRNGGDTMRGWASSTFGEMVKDGRLVYSRKGNKWKIGPMGLKVLNQHFYLHKDSSKNVVCVLNKVA